MHGIRWTVKRVLAGIAALLVMLLLLALLGIVVMLLWNWLVPGLFHGPTLGYWQALGLLVLSRLLFGGLRGHGHWRQRWWRERWEQMTPDERERLRERFAQRCRRNGGSTPNAAAPGA